MAVPFDEKTFVADLRSLVKFPSVSSDPAHAADVADCAAHLNNRLKALHADTRIVKTKRHPLIAARIEQNPSWPTIALYGHYDVQPIAAPDKWESDPFLLRIEGDKYFARGASDNKGNLVAAIHAVEKALEDRLKLNFAFLCEGEEELGSPNFRQAVQAASDFIKPDCTISVDGHWVSRERPSVGYGMRGLLYMHWDIRTGEKAVHSGSLGGAARNPLIELMAAAMKCYDPDTGKILIPGLYDTVRPTSEKELCHWLDSIPSPDELRETYKLKALRHKDKAALAKAIIAMPTFEIHGCVGGYMKKDGKMTVIPPDGQLLVSLRLVPDQNPDDIFDLVRDFVARVNPEIHVTKTAAARPYSTDPDGKEINAACRALTEVSGYPACKMRGGGTIGALAEMYDHLGKAPTFIMAFSLPEHDAHSPNEHFDRAQAQTGVAALYAFFKALAG